jgi:sulfite oxidase
VKHESLIVWTDEPLNAETPLDLLCRAPVTPTELFYVRNHGPVPAVDLASYRLTVGGLVGRPRSLTLDDLGRFERVMATATMICAGNRRDELARVTPIPGQAPWGPGAVGNAVWGGVRLRDVLRDAGADESAGHVAFTGLDEAAEDGEVVEFGGSIPLEKALGPDVLLADEMNGEPLPPEHGHPLRLVVPGYIGARSVKWLSTMTVQREPSANFFQSRTYRILPPGSSDPEDGFALGELPLSSAVCRVERLAGGIVRARGYAIAGGTRRVERVDVSVDGGATFATASLAGEAQPGAWLLWEAELAAPAGTTELAVRAWDSAGSTQPEDPARLWNPKGYANNAWHRVRLPAASS